MKSLLEPVLEKMRREHPVFDSVANSTRPDGIQE